ncbi:MAG: serpin family protein [candidate division WOR-3 bacterium]
MYTLLVLALFSSPLRGANPPVAPELLAAAKNRFGFALVNELAAVQPAENLLISPYSIATALTMTANGAAGETKNVMLKTLSLSGIRTEELNTGEKNLLDSLITARRNVTLEIANSIWARQGIAFKSAFRQGLQHFYSAELFTLDFNSPDAASRINSWVSRRTHDKIRSIISRINPEHALFLINAVYFKGKWQQPFDPQLTAEDIFYLPDNRTVRVQMMHRSGKFSYFAGAGFEAVEMPYGQGKISMFLLLPEEKTGLPALLKQLTPENWSAWRARFASRQGEIALPRFRIEYEQSLKPALSQLGMGLAFDLNRADFSAMCSQPRLAIGDVKHKSFIEVNEEGTEAAAVTSVEMVMTAIPVNTFNLVFNRPFLFLIQDNTTGTILFIGTVVHPAPEK